MQSTLARIAASRTPLTWLLVLVGLSYGVALFNHGLVPSMEPRFAEVVREMIASGEWLVPIKNGRPYVEYPPLYYWIAIGLKLTGLPMTVAIRLPSYVGFLAWLFLLSRLQQFMAPQWPRYAFALVGATLPIAMFQFAIAQTDSLLALGVLLALFGYAAHRRAPVAGRCPWLMWWGVTLACAAKGPVGAACTLPVIAADAFAAVVLARRSAGPPASHVLSRIVAALASLCWVRGLLLVAASTVPWYLAGGLTRGWDFVNAVLVYQNVDRYLTGYSHSQPWWYYAETLSYDFFPVSLLLPVGLWLAWSRRRQDPERLALIWTAWTLLFFSVSGSKQGKYLLPAAPGIIALGFLALDYLRARLGVPGWAILRTWSAALLIIWSLLIVAVLPAFSERIGGVAGYLPLREQLQRAPGRLVHYQWPRSMTLYELGAPMDFVRSARELYARIANGTIGAGDYVLVRKSDLGGSPSLPGSQLSPYPNPAVFDEVLATTTDTDVVLLRIRAGAARAGIPPTPDPPPVLWRDELFDTD